MPVPTTTFPSVPLLLFLLCFRLLGGWCLDANSHLEKPRDIRLPPSWQAGCQGLLEASGIATRWQQEESSDLLLSPGDFHTVFAELLFQAGQEVAPFPRNPSGLSSMGTYARGWWQLRALVAGWVHSHVTAMGNDCRASWGSEERSSC